MLPLAAANLLVLAIERLVIVENEIENDFIWWAFAVVNIALTVALVVGWSKLLGYRPRSTPLRPRLVREAGGYVPLDAPVRGSR
jgi:hypothetical protein